MLQHKSLENQYVGRHACTSIGSVTADWAVNTRVGSIACSLSCGTYGDACVPCHGRKEALPRRAEPRAHITLSPNFWPLLSCFRAIVRGDVPLAAITESDNQETVFRRQQRFQFPVEPLHLAYCETATNAPVDAYHTRAVFVDDTPALRLGNVVTNYVPMFRFSHTCSASVGLPRSAQRLASMEFALWLHRKRIRAKSPPSFIHSFSKAHLQLDQACIGQRMPNDRMLPLVCLTAFVNLDEFLLTGL